MNKFHKSKEEYLYHEKESRGYKNVNVPRESVYRLFRYYRQNKTMPQLKMLVVSAVSIDTECDLMYWCVV